MQSGLIKHWNSDKGYGFIDVDDQTEDVFFHISNVQLPPPITVGQRVYFTSQRNHKNQLSALKVTSSSLSIEQDDAPTASKPTSRHPKRAHSRSSGRANRHTPPKKSLGSTLLSLIAFIAVAVYFFGDIRATLFDSGVDAIVATQNSAHPTQRSTTSDVTGDAQIDRTIALIQQGGPFPYPHKDGTTFYNREGKLPAQAKGYYHEYTVPTPGVSHRGARRIVTGGHPPAVYYLTVNHYDSFRKLDVK